MLVLCTLLLALASVVSAETITLDVVGYSVSFDPGTRNVVDVDLTYINDDIGFGIAKEVFLGDGAIKLTVYNNERFSAMDPTSVKHTLDRVAHSLGDFKPKTTAMYIDGHPAAKGTYYHDGVKYCAFAIVIDDYADVVFVSQDSASCTKAINTLKIVAP
jgi:hypothetical protein